MNVVNKFTSLLLRLVIPPSLATSSCLVTDGGSLNAMIQIIQLVWKSTIRKIFNVMHILHPTAYNLKHITTLCICNWLQTIQHLLATIERQQETKATDITMTCMKVCVLRTQFIDMVLTLMSQCLWQAVGPGVLQTFSTCAVKP